MGNRGAVAAAEKFGGDGSMRMAEGAITGRAGGRAFEFPGLAKGDCWAGEALAQSTALATVSAYVQPAMLARVLRFFSLAALFLSVLFSGNVLSQELTVQADRWCPYNCEPHSTEPGYIVEVLQAIFEPKNVKIRYEIVPWDRTLMQTRDGKADAAIAATEHEIKAYGLVVGRESVGFSSDCLFVGANNNIKFSNASDLNALGRIGVSSGYSYSVDIDAWLKRPENKGKIFVQKGENPAEINARNLSVGRLDGVIEDDHVMQHIIAKLGIEHTVVLAGCQKQTRIFVAFSPKLKNVQQVVKDFDDGMEALRQSQKLAKILAKYGLSDWK